MSLQIAVAHTGQRLDADLVAFSTIDSLKQWIASATQIPAASQVLLTPRGKHVKLQALLTEKEIFVYDRELSSAPQSAPSPLPLPEPFAPGDPPSTLSDQRDLRAWQLLFETRRDWALGLLDKSQAMSAVAAQHLAEQATINRATQIAVGNHHSHIRSLEERLQAAREWWEGVAKETGHNLRRLDSDYAQLASVPARAEFVHFFPKDVRSAQAVQAARRKSADRNITLQEYLDAESVKKAAGTSRRVKESFGMRVSDMKARLEKVATDYNDLLSAVGQNQSQSLPNDSEEPTNLYDEIKAVVVKVESDLDHVMGLPANAKSVAQVSKMALLHTRNFLPAIKEYSTEMSELVRRAVEQKNLALQNAVHSMQSIASIESVISSLSAELESIDLPEEGVVAFEMISLVSRLPFVYGSLLVEAVRRREWLEKMQKDISALAEEMATYQDEEERRRKKWLKTIADAVSVESVQSNMLGFEMNVQPDKNPWPEVSRDDLQGYINQLKRLDGHEADIEALNQAIKDLDRPTKQQVKRAKNFKMGSVHEAAFGRGSQLMLRGDDDMRVLKEANSKLEDELKTSKSRVRRLEDLLHRQSQSYRLSIADGMPSFGPQSPDPSTPTIETASAARAQGELSRRSSLSSRRLSTNQGSDDKRKLVLLEQQLAVEREARATLEKEAQARAEEHAELKRQLDEAKSMKENIMQNMKAQQQEFAGERRSLEEEIQTYKSKVEDAEDELDRVLGSRDNERTGVDLRIQELISELKKVRSEASEQDKHANEQISTLETELQNRRDAEARQHESLATAFNRLSTNGTDVPEDYATLVAQLEDLSLRSHNHLEELQRAVAEAKSENEAMQARAQEHAAELKTMLHREEAECSSLRERLDTEKAKVRSITAELEEERGHLHDLRKKFAEGETGSEALRKRVEEEEDKVGRLQLQLVEVQSHANALDVELMHAQKKISKYEKVDSSQSPKRALRAKELSERFYRHQERLLRLLDSLGFNVSYDDGAMILQRESKMKSSNVLSDANALGRSGTAPSPTPLKRVLDEITDLSFLQWPESTKPEEEEARYQKFMEALGRFDVETFSEAILKRMRDMEHTARKWQKEARGYRDKSHRFQTDAHEKIAFRHFKEGDLALFLPTRNQAARPWAAFNIGAPHYFLREQESHKLHGREYLVARIGKIQERVVDLSKTIESGAGRASLDGRSVASESALSCEDDNPFGLSDGLRWYLIDAVEEKPGAPGTPGLGKSTVASARVTGQGHVEPTKKKASNDPAKTLGKSLDSRRSSGTSRNSVPVLGPRTSAEGLAPSEHAVESGPNSTTATRGVSPAAPGSAPGPASSGHSGGRGPSHLRETTDATIASRMADATREEAARSGDVGDQVRKDLMWGP